MRFAPALIFIMTIGLFSHSSHSVENRTMTSQINFKDPNEAKNWVIVNDTVMGGRSRATLKLEQEMLVFSGDLSLRNNGGFASTRRIYDPVTWDSKQAIEIQVLGDGRSYQFRLRTNRNADGIAYVANFTTQKNSVQSIKFELSDFTAQFRGRLIRGAPDLSFADVAQMGFMLADKKEGPFALKIISLQSGKLVEQQSPEVSL